MGFNSGFKGLNLLVADTPGVLPDKSCNYIVVRLRIKSSVQKLSERHNSTVYLVSGYLIESWHILWSNILSCRSQWPRGLRRSSAAARLLRSWVRIPPGAWIFVCCECCVLSGRGLCDELITRPEESYWLWCVVVCDLETFVNEEALAHWGLSRQKKSYKFLETNRTFLLKMGSTVGDSFIRSNYLRTPV